MPRPALLLSDVDGTLVTPDKQLTPAARDAVRRLGEAGIGFTVASSRPARGLAMLVEALDLRLPIVGLNGAQLVDPASGAELDRLPLPAGAAAAVLATIDAHGLSVWLFDGRDWFIRDPDGPNVAREQRTVGFAPTLVAAFDAALLARALKIVATSHDHPAVERCEAAVREALGGQVSATRSQPYYLDITHAEATKARAVAALAHHMDLAPASIVAIGDAHNDVPMFRAAGLGIAMGNAVPEVQQAAGHVTARNTEEGFAKAVDWLLEG